MTGEGFRDIGTIPCEETPDSNGGLGRTIREASPPTPQREFFSPPRGLSSRVCVNPVCFDSSHRCDGRTNLSLLSCVKSNEEAVNSVLGNGDLAASFTLRGITDTATRLHPISSPFFRADSFDSFNKPVWRLPLTVDPKTPGGGPTHPNSL